MKGIRFENDRLYLLDQTRLPRQETWLEFTDYHKVVAAIKAGVVTGGSAIGIVGAYAYLLAATASSALPGELFSSSMVRVKKEIISSHPLRRELKYALEKMERVLALHDWKPRACEDLKSAALDLHLADAEKNREIARQGLTVVPKGARILTTASTGELSSGGYGTALGIIRSAHRAERLKMAFICESRPDFEGSRIAAYELALESIPVTVHTDSSAAVLMRNKLIDLVIIPSELVAANGDILSTPGAYALCALSRLHGIPFYAVAGDHTIDLSTENESRLRFEQRSAESLIDIGPERVYAQGVKLFNPSCDIIPHSLITGIITKKGVIYPPFSDELVNLFL